MWDDDYITIRYNASTQQIQYYPKSGKGWSWQDGGLIFSQGANYTVKGDSSYISASTNQWHYLSPNGSRNSSYDFKNYATQILGFVLSERFDSDIPAYLIRAVCGRATDSAGGATSFAVIIERLEN